MPLKLTTNTKAEIEAIYVGRVDLHKVLKIKMADVKVRHPGEPDELIPGAQVEVDLTELECEHVIYMLRE